MVGDGDVGRSLADAVAQWGYVTELRIIKTRFTLTVLHRGSPLKSYRVALGQGGFGDKIREGDRKTPEGEFFITEKLMLNNHHFLGSCWMRLSYPNIEHAERGYRAGLISWPERERIIEAIRRWQTPPQNTALGGGIGIHGGSGTSEGTQGDFWTHGCVALTDADAMEVHKWVEVRRTKVAIVH